MYNGLCLQIWFLRVVRLPDIDNRINLAKFGYVGLRTELIPKFLDFCYFGFNLDYFGSIFD
jgi:hypothetical protein